MSDIRIRILENAINVYEHDGIEWMRHALFENKQGDWMRHGCASRNEVVSCCIWGALYLGANDELGIPHNEQVMIDNDELRYFSSVDISSVLDSIEENIKEVIGSNWLNRELRKNSEEITPDENVSLERFNYVSVLPLSFLRGLSEKEIICKIFLEAIGKIAMGREDGEEGTQAV